MALMRAAVLDGYGQPLRLAQVPVPVPGPGEILIKLEASGVCHSDVHVWKGESVASPPPDPYILGHEGVGVVVAGRAERHRLGLGRTGGGRRGCMTHAGCARSVAAGTKAFVPHSGRTAIMCRGRLRNMSWRRRPLRCVCRTAGPDTAALWADANRAHATINFALTPRTWDAMKAATRPLGRIVAAAMVAEPVPLVQEWLTWTGISITGTSVGTRAQMRDLMALHEAAPLQASVEEIRLADVSDALVSLAEGRAKGRYCVVY